VLGVKSDIDESSDCDEENTNLTWKYIHSQSSLKTELSSTVSSQTTFVCFFALPLLEFQCGWMNDIWLLIGLCWCCVDLLIDQ
jgi:hypothetical protein